MDNPVSASMAGDTDEANQVRLAQEHPSAFADLYQRYLPCVYHYVRTRLESEEEAADLTQQIFLQALDALPSYQLRGVPFSAWLFKIARNAVTDVYRRQKSVVSWDSQPGMAHSLSTQQDLDAELMHQERLIHLKTLIARLNPEQRELLALRFAGGLSTSQIVLVVGKSPAAVKKQLTRLLHTLKEQYREQ